MSTLNQITYNILSKVRPHMSDDSELTPELVKYDIAKERSRMIRNEYNRNRTFPETIIQDLGCLDLEIADAAECCDIDSGCTVLRTKDKIPFPVELHHHLLITRVGPIVKTKERYKYVTYNHAIKSGNGMFSDKLIYAFYLNDRIYLKSNSNDIALLKKINVRGIFQDPREAAVFNICGTETACYSDDTEYPLMDWMERYIVNTLKKSYLQQLGIPVDLGNDAKDGLTDGASTTKK